MRLRITGENETTERGSHRQVRADTLSMVEWPMFQIWTAQRFLLKRNASALHVQRLKIATRLFPQDAKNIKTGFITVAKMPEFHFSRQSLQQFQRARTWITGMDEQFAGLKLGEFVK